MAESNVGTYAALAGIEIVNDSRTFAYLKNGLGPSSVSAYGNCSCPNLAELLGCETLKEFPTINGVVFNGASGGYVSSPDSVATSIMGDIQIDVEFSTPNLTPSSSQNLLAKWIAAGNQRSYRLQLNTSGGLSLSWTTDGTTIVTKSSTFSLPFLNGDKIYVRAALDVNNGAGGNDVYFWYSSTGITYTPLGTIVTTAGTTSIYDSPSPIELGSQDSGTNNLFVGTIYSAKIRNGIVPSGVVVADPNFKPEDPAITQASSSIMDSQGNTWTNHGSVLYAAGTVDVPVLDQYVSPENDGAPWYTPDAPESADFLGFIVDEFEGLNSPFKRQVQESIGNGGVLSRSRLGTRQMKWSGYLFGATCSATYYGLRWLTKTLARFDSSCRDCFGEDLEILISCPNDGEDVAPFKTLKGVGLLEGPNVVSEKRTCSSACKYGCGGNGSCIIEIEFTLVASQPFLYSPPISVYDCVSITDGATSPLTSSTTDCGDEDCSTGLLDDLCPSPVLPPTAGYVSNCVPTLVNPLANYFSVSRSYWNDLDEVVPIISITTGSLAVGYIQLGFYSSGSDSPCSDLISYPPDCDVICDELGIIGIPAESTFYIDSRTRRMAVVCADGTAYPGEKLTSGPWSWPSFNCYGFCMEVLFDTQENYPAVTGLAAYELACVSISLVPRTF